MFDNRLKGHHRDSLGQSQSVKKDEYEDFLQKTPTDNNGIIYFHIPYCDNICSFCNLNRSKASSGFDDYTKYLIDNINYYAKFPYIKDKIFKSVYFGGGTPTILNKNNLEKILTHINSNFKLSNDVEISFESTLHNLSISKIKLMQSLGVNRYSIGIQTFSDRGRKILNRVGDKKNAINKLEKIKANFDGHLCLDIIYNYPDQSLDEVKEDANIIKSLSIDSASFYSLQIHEGSEFSKDYSFKYYKLEQDYKLHREFLETMLACGNYELLEYTKVRCKNRDRYMYIRLSHQGVDILPIGVGSGGRLGNYSIFNINQDIKAISKMANSELEYSLFSNLFQYSEIDLEKIKNLVDEKTFQALIEFFKKCESEGYLSIEDDMLKYNIDGIFWGNTIANEVIKIAKKYFLEKYKIENKGR